jgi:hypothetical protein
LLKVTNFFSLGCAKVVVTKCLLAQAQNSCYGESTFDNLHMSIEYFKQPEQGLTFDGLYNFCERYIDTLRIDPKYITECLLPEMIGKEIRDMQTLETEISLPTEVEGIEDKINLRLRVLSLSNLENADTVVIQTLNIDKSSLLIPGRSSQIPICSVRLNTKYGDVLAEVLWPKQTVEVQAIGPNPTYEELSDSEKIQAEEIYEKMLEKQTKVVIGLTDQINANNATQFLENYFPELVESCEIRNQILSQPDGSRVDFVSVGEIGVERLRNQHEIKYQPEKYNIVIHGLGYVDRFGEAEFENYTAHEIVNWQASRNLQQLFATNFETKYLHILQKYSPRSREFLAFCFANYGEKVGKVVFMLENYDTAENQSSYLAKINQLLISSVTEQNHNILACKINQILLRNIIKNNSQAIINEIISILSSTELADLIIHRPETDQLIV